MSMLQVAKTRVSCIIIVAIFSLITALGLPISIVTAQTGTGAAATRTVVARYEALRVLTEVHNESGSRNPSCYMQANRLNGQLQPISIPLMPTISATQYNDSSFSPIVSQTGNIPVPFTLFQPDNQLSCARALYYYYSGRYSGANDVEKRRAFINDYYEISGNSYVLREGASARLHREARTYMLGLISGRTDSFIFWRDRIINAGFHDCWTWDHVTPFEDATIQQRFTNDSWRASNDGNRSVGYMAETEIEDRYQDGVVTCNGIRDFVFKSGNRYILDFDEAKHGEEVDAINTQRKKESILGLFTTSTDGLAFCATGHGHENLKSGWRLIPNMERVAGWLAEGGEGELKRADGRMLITSAKAADFRNCMLTAYGDRLQSIMDREVDLDLSRDDPAQSDDEEEEPTCESEGGSFGWALCPIVDMILVGINSFGDMIQARLDFTIQEQDALRGAWGNIRTIANVLFIMAFLIIIISQTLTGRF